MSTPAPSDRDDGDAKNDTSGQSPTLDALLAKINKLRLSSDVQEKISDIASNSTATTAYLKMKNIGDDAAVAIGEGLSRNTTLTYLNLAGNNISDKGAVAIGEGLNKNATLEILNLQNNNISDEGAVAIGEGLSKHATLNELDLDSNNISDAGAIAIGEGLGKSATLKTLRLSNNNISDEGAAVIGEGLSKNTTLKTLQFNGNKMTHAGFLSLAKGFRWNKTLTVLDADPEGTNYQDTDVTAKLGSGEFGSVILASTRGTKKEVVEKISHGISNHEEIYEKLILQGLPDHKNVVRLAGLSTQDTLLLDAHKGGSLKDYAKKHEGGIPLESFFRYSHGMSRAIEHLHENGVVHRDIALRNYVLTEDLQTAVLVDFGLSCPIHEEKSVKIRPAEKMPFRQCAPEVIYVFEYSKASDIWQLGVSIWQLLQRGRQPFSSMRSAQKLLQYLTKKMVHDKGHIPLSFKKNGAKAALICAVEEVVVFCCPHDPAERPTATQLVEKIESLRRSAEASAADVTADEEREVAKYVPDKNAVDDGLMAYKYTDYEELDNAGGSDYIDLADDMEDSQEIDEDDYQEIDEEDQEIDEVP